jgi:HAD superfamily hydrolase (TIGR01549 family)
MYWILDFDDTLAVGPNTWAFEVVLPQLIQERNLPYDKTLFDSVMLQAQEKANNQDLDDAEVFNFVFESLHWTIDLRSELEQRVYKEYQPALYPDTQPFLEKLAAAGHTLFIISNNNHAPALAQMFGITDYFSGIYTPKLCENVSGKPKRDMWDYVMRQVTIDATQDVWMVGDDPWADGAFAQVCGHKCWILDRLGRYESLHGQFPFQWAATFEGIEF